MRFDDRRDAGRQLAARLGHLVSQDPVVLGLPRGGVPVAGEVARVLGAPLDVLIVRKIGVPSQPELAMGAIGEGGVRVLNLDVLRLAGVSEEDWVRVEEREWAELERRARDLRGPHPRIPLAGRVAVIVDDGLATGSTAKAACRVARAAGAARVVLAVPVAPAGWERSFENEADELVAVVTPESFRAVGQWYTDFDQTTDSEVEACLSTAQLIDREVAIDARGVELGGHLTIPAGSTGLVLFAHGSGSSRHSPRNQFVAHQLNAAGIGTLLFDLLTEAESRDRRAVFDIDLLAERLATATTWARTALAPTQPAIGYFGASTGAAAALVAAASATGDEVTAVVSRGGRPDLAGSSLPLVAAPTLLIVGGADEQVLELNREAQAAMTCPTRLIVIPGASHLFEEPGTLEAAAAAATDWFSTHLTR
jgi:putative phosphoribosyl transferase